MAEIFNFYVQDNRTIQFPKNNLLEPIMQEDYKVATWRFRIPKTLNGIDMSGWAWWFVYVNARGQEFSELLTLVDDIDEPDSFCTADYSIDYGISYHPGNFQFSLEAINAGSGGEVLNEWHTKTYAHKVDKTLQGNRAQWSETESDIISALIVEVQNKVAQLVGGATPEPKSLIADMTDTKKVYLYVGEESGESTNYWYYHNGSAWVAGGLYASGITVDSVPTQGSTNAVRSGGVYEALQNINVTTDTTLSVSGKPADAKAVGDALAEKVDAVSGKGLSTNDYTDAEKQKVTNATADLTAITTATAEDEGKALKAKTVSNGKVTEWEFGETGASGNYVEYTSKQSGELSPTTVDKTDSVTGKLNYSTGVVGTGSQTISNFIDISKTTRFYRSSTVTTKYLSDIYCLYDENYNYLAGFDGNTSYTFETIDGHANCIRYDLSTQGAHYMRTQFNIYDAFTYYKVDTYDIYDTEIKEVHDARTDYNDVEQNSLADALDASYTAIKGEFSDVADEISDLKGFESAGTAKLVYPYNSAKAVKLTANASMTLGVHGITVADSDHMGTVTYSNIEEVTSYTGKGKKYRITTLGNNGNAYRISGRVTGLTVGKTYRICFKITDPQNNSSGGGHFAQIYCKTTLTSIGKKVSKEGVFSKTFEASSTAYDIYIYPFMSNSSAGYTQAIGDEFVIEDWYINEINDGVDLYTHEGCFNTSVTGTELEYTLNGKMFVATGDGASVYISHMSSKLLTVNNTEPDADGDVTVKSHLQDKKIVYFGDSITEKGNGEYFDFPYVSGEITGASIINAGIGGTSMRYRTNHNTWNMASFANMADMIVSGDFSDIATLGTTSGFEKADRCKELAPILEAIDWNDVDIITLAYGANDFETSTAVNHLDDSEDADNKYTYIGAFRYALNTILAEYPHIQFLVLTPVFRFWTVDGVVLNSDERTFEDINGTIHYYLWGDALKTCAQNEYHAPVCDLYRELGVNGVNYTWFSTDGVHPNKDGLIRMGNHIASALISKL